jgi:Tfp pilus assembly protein PilF
LGILHFAQNDPNTARKCFERALELDPGFKEAKAKLDMLRDLKPVKQSA